jgi:hypothetical protein
MKTARCTILASVLIMAASGLHAQGLLGERHGSLDASYSRYQGLEFGSVGVTVNAPVAPGADFVGFYSYDADLESGFDLRAHSFTGGLRPYYQMGDGVKLFGEGMVSYIRSTVRFAGTRELEQPWYWLLGVGAEAMINERLAILPSIRYADDFEGGDSVWIYTVQAHQWLNETTGVGLGIAYENFRRDGHSWNYFARATFRF